MEKMKKKINRNEDRLQDPKRYPSITSALVRLNVLEIKVQRLEEEKRKVDDFLDSLRDIYPNNDAISLISEMIHFIWNPKKLPKKLASYFESGGLLKND